MKVYVRENCKQQYEIFCSSEVQREHSLAFPRQHSKAFIVLKAKCWSTVQTERTVEFP
jgi:hypothetical protein